MNKYLHVIYSEFLVIYQHN